MAWIHSYGCYAGKERYKVYADEEAFDRIDKNLSMHWKQGRKNGNIQLHIGKDK